MLPDKNTLSEKFLDVGDGHRLYVQEWGSESGAPILFLHGGPGSGCSDRAKELFDPHKHRVIFFDQRGSGKSLPYGLLEANDTGHLVADVTRVADSFGLDAFSLVGGSWGSCLALVYAIQNPRKVKSLVLRGIFTGRRSEIEYLTKGECRNFFPDIWEAFELSVPEKYRHDPFMYHRNNLESGNIDKQKESALAYGALEGSVGKLDDRVANVQPEMFDPTSTLLEMHYLVNNCFLEDGYILNNAHRISAPTLIVQGRYDFVCPPITAYELSKKIPNSDLMWTLAGHSGGDRANYEAVKTHLLNKT